MVRVDDHVCTGSSGTPVPNFAVCHRDDGQNSEDDNAYNEDSLNLCDGLLEAVEEIVDQRVVGAECQFLLVRDGENGAVEFIDADGLVNEFLE